MLEFRQRKTLSVWLATPPWDLKPGETVVLKLDIRSRHGVRTLAELAEGTRRRWADLTGEEG